MANLHSTQCSFRHSDLFLALTSDWLGFCPEIGVRDRSQSVIKSATKSAEEKSACFEKRDQRKTRHLVFKSV